MTPETQEIQQTIDHAFAQFKNDNPEVARTIEIMKMSFPEYVSVLLSTRTDIQTVSGNIFTPTPPWP